MSNLQTFWNGKRVFLTGHTGFKGSWLALWLQTLGSKVRGYALAPTSSPSLYEALKLDQQINSVIADVRDLNLLKKSILEFEPDIIIHMAAQAIVRESYLDPVYTYETNVMGTVNVIESARHCPSVKAIVNVTSDKCYENIETNRGYVETDPKGGHDPYSSSKGCSELVTSSYARSFFPPTQGKVLASARAGNVIGGGDWAVDRLVPDILRAFENQEVANIRNPEAIRPWQHVLEPLSGYLCLAEKMYTHGHEFSGGWNFGPADHDAKPVAQIANLMVEKWEDEASWSTDNDNHPHEAKFLRLDCQKANQLLGWAPRWSLENTLTRIVKWHKQYLAGVDPEMLCLADIQLYQATLV